MRTIGELVAAEQRRRADPEPMRVTRRLMFCPSCCRSYFEPGVDRAEYVCADGTRHPAASEVGAVSLGTRGVAANSTHRQGNGSPFRGRTARISLARVTRRRAGCG